MNNITYLFRGKNFDPTHSNLGELLGKMKSQSNPIEGWDDEDFIVFFEAASKEMISKASPVASLISTYDLGFIVAWMKKNSIKTMLKSQLDWPNFEKKQGNRLLFHKPRGTAVHWIAGNVPVLGVISLFQGLMSRNKNVIKAPKSFSSILGLLLEFLAELKIANGKKTLLGSDLLSSVLVLYIEKTDTDSQTLLSKNADVRVAWGGIEAVESIAALPKKIDCKDIIFGPKVSLALITENFLTSASDSELGSIARALAKDTFAFGQAGCNAPHNLIFLGKPQSFEPFKVQLEEAMSLEASHNSKYSFDAIDSYNVLEKRFLFGVSSKKAVIEGDNLSFSIFISKDKIKIYDPIYCYSLFVSFMDNLDQLKQIIPANVQTVGLACTDSEKMKIAELLFNVGALRVTKLGRMALYSQPWDGFLPIQEMVKWVSLEI